ncbi:helix-turn-helix domain-containing protein [Bradyrhizobium erythrophlei]|uniref:Transcriptional regulator, AraC family n=1 Tax=Bradyrhizobium erythrophlei TaxID=1437360 RepID=A0A1H5JKR0_9BRAD|nr:helix-turn-helix domain-containing protein [Bradyrhizobium erythrophlei]SEE53082.1 transcriptional regulator, AraC family [Bradyrhizobium erythrophlei]
MQLQEFSSWTPEVWGQPPLEEWRNKLRSVCGRFNPFGQEERGFVNGGVVLRDAAGMEIVQVATDVDVVRRAERDIRQDYGEHFFLLVQLQGVCGVEQQGHQSIISPGDCILVDSSLPSNFFFNGQFSNHLSVHLPRQLLLSEKPNDFEVSRRLGAEDPMSTMLRALVAKMLQMPSSHKRSGELRQLLLQATRQAFAADPPDTPLCPKERASGRLEFARALVDRHLTAEWLTAQWLANRLGVSMRTLQEDFSAVGTTVTSFIRDRRLRLAKDRLLERQRGSDGGTIAEIAYSSGFNDISYFNRCFKRAFDCSPTDVTRR